jgi:hypothetical protein
MIEGFIYLTHRSKGHNLQKLNNNLHSPMIDKLRQLLLSIIGIGAFGFVFYLVFKDDKRFMIGLLAVVVGLILIVLLIGLIGRIRDNAQAKKRKKPFNP